MFGDYIKNLRIAKGLTQADISEGVGIKIPYYSRIENNRDNPPSENILLRLAAVLDEDPHHLIVKAGKVPSDFKELIIKDETVFNYLKRKTKTKDKSGA